MPSPETQSSNEQFDHRLEKGEQEPSGEKLELSPQEKEQGVHERIEDWHKTHDLPHNLSDIESRIEDIENSIKQLEVIAHTSEFAKEKIQQNTEKKSRLEVLKTLGKRVGTLLGAGLVAAGANIGNPSDANAFYQEGNLETAGSVGMENTDTSEGQGNTEEEDTENKGQVNQQEESDDLLWGSEQESSAPENNLDNQEPLEEQDLTQEEDVSVETTQEISSESEQESAFVKQAQELLNTAQERESQYLDTIQGIVTAIEEQALTEPEMEEAISLGESFLRLEELSNQDEQEDDGGEEQELQEPDDGGEEQELQESDDESGELVNFGFVRTPENDAFQATVTGLGTGVYFTEDENCIQTVEHAVSEGEDQELYFYYGELRNVGDNVYDEYHIIRHPQADYAIMIEKSPEAVAACQDYLEGRGEKVPADLEDFAHQYQDQVLTHIGNRDREATSHEEEQFYDEPYQLNLQVTEYSAYDLIDDFVDSNDLDATELSQTLVTFTSEDTTGGNSGSPIFNQQGEVVGAHKGRISLERLREAFDNEQDKDDPDMEKIEFLQKAIDHTQDGGSISIIVPVTQETQQEMLDQFPGQE